MTDLEKELEQQAESLERLIAKAEAELAETRARAGNLERVIARARAMLGDTQARAVGPERLTLHEAMRIVLEEAGSDGLSGPDLRDQIVSRGLYYQRDGRPVSINQIHARARNYTDLFAKREGRFTLAEG